MTRKRHRKSINPFRLRIDVERPDWAAIMGGIDKPVEVDLGFGRGEFLIERALQDPDTLFVGIEIRDYLIEKMRERLEAEPRPNIHLVRANVKQHLPALFDPGMLSCVYIHFPDPWTHRKRHHKRRMVDAKLVSDLSVLVRSGGQVRLMTDKRQVGMEMLALFQAHDSFENVYGVDQFGPDLATHVRTREETYYLCRGDPVYRLAFVRRPLAGGNLNQSASGSTER